VDGQIEECLMAKKYLPFMAENRLHVVPPCVVTEAEALEGLQILNEVLGSI